MRIKGVVGMFIGFLIVTVMAGPLPAWADIETHEIGYSTDGENWEFQTVTTFSSGYTAVFFGGQIFYVFGSEFTGATPLGNEGLCWCSVLSNPRACCMCLNYCSVNGAEGRCSSPCDC